MYQLFFNGHPLFDPRDEELQIREPDIRLAVGEAGEMSFVIDRDHPHADKLTRLKGVLDLRASGRSILKARIRKDTQDFYLSRTIEAEGLLACLNDSIIPPFNFPDDFLENTSYQTAVESGNVIQFFLGWLLDQHNSQVGNAQKIQLGDVTVADPNNYISRASSEYLTTRDAIHSKLVDLLGGYLLPDYSGETTVLHYYADLPLTNTQVVEYGENLRDLVSMLDSADTYTAILPVGAEGLTIADLPDGELSPGIIKEGRIIYSQAAETACGGRITRVVKWDDVTLAENLKTKAMARLTGEGTTTAQEITVTAADLGGTEDISRFTVGRYVRMQSTPHGFVAAYPLMELVPDIFDPGNTTITLGAVVKGASDLAHGNQSAVQDQLDKVQMELNQQQSSIAAVGQTISTQITEAIQTSKDITFQALEKYVKTSDYEEYKSETSTQLALIPGELNIKINNNTNKIDNVNGDLQAKYESITKHFRFTDEGLLIGESGNEVLLRLDNDVVQFLRANVPELYMDSKGVHAEELHAKTIHIGSYVLQAEDDGRVTLRKAVSA